MCEGFVGSGHELKGVAEFHHAEFDVSFFDERCAPVCFLVDFFVVGLLFRLSLIKPA